MRIISILLILVILFSPIFNKTFGSDGTSIPSEIENLTKRLKELDQSLATLGEEKHKLLKELQQTSSGRAKEIIQRIDEINKVVEPLRADQRRVAEQLKQTWTRVETIADLKKGIKSGGPTPDEIRSRVERLKRFRDRIREEKTTLSAERRQIAEEFNRIDQEIKKLKAEGKEVPRELVEEKKNLQRILREIKSSQEKVMITGARNRAELSASEDVLKSLTAKEPKVVVTIKQQITDLIKEAVESAKMGQPGTLMKIIKIGGRVVGVVFIVWEAKNFVVTFYEFEGDFISKAAVATNSFFTVPFTPELGIVRKLFEIRSAGGVWPYVWKRHIVQLVEEIEELESCLERSESGQPTYCTYIGLFGSKRIVFVDTPEELEELKSRIKHLEESLERAMERLIEVESK